MDHLILKKKMIFWLMIHMNILHYIVKIGKLFNKLNNMCLIHIILIDLHYLSYYMIIPVNRLMTWYLLFHLGHQLVDHLEKWRIHRKT